MSTKEWARMLACQRVTSGTLNVTEAASMLSISTRQMRRSLRRYEERGDAGLLHASRGSVSNRATDPVLKDAILSRVCERYEDFGPTLAAEKLALEGLDVNHETLRRWMDETGLREARPRKARHRSSREPKKHFGELVQMDGSHHDWFEGRRARCCLMQMVDDATGVRMMLLSEEETTLAALQLLDMWIGRHGVPAALYTDKKSVYRSPRGPTIEEELQGVRPLTAFGKVCASLGITITVAHSPQAKGRVERANGVAQDRLVKELRLAGAPPPRRATRSSPQASSTPVFAHEPASAADFHRALAPGEDLAVVLRVREERVLTSDYTLRHEGRVLLGPQAAGSASAEGHAHRRPVPGWHPENGSHRGRRTRLPGRDGPDRTADPPGGSPPLLRDHRARSQDAPAVRTNPGPGPERFSRPHSRRNGNRQGARGQRQFTTRATGEADPSCP